MLGYSTEQNPPCLRRFCHERHRLIWKVPNLAELEAPARLDSSSRKQMDQIAKALVGSSKTQLLQPVPPAPRGRNAGHNLRMGEIAACSLSFLPVSKSSQLREAEGKYPAGGCYDKGLWWGMQPLGTTFRAEEAAQSVIAVRRPRSRAVRRRTVGGGRRSTGQCFVARQMNGSRRETCRIGRARSLSDLFCRRPSPT